MSTALIEEVAAGRAPELAPFTVEQLERMLASGILAEGEAIELIEGLLVRKDRASASAEGDCMGHGTHHATAVRCLQRLDHAVGAIGCCLQVQLPIVLSPTNAPEPDLAILRGGPEDYALRHPGPVDILAVLEVADHSLVYDRGTKQRLCAAASIALYLIVNLPETCFELYEEPRPAEGRYARCTTHLQGQTVRLQLNAADAIEIEVSTIL